MNNQEIVQKLWNLCNVLRDDGITYQQYVTELTYLLFLKMMKEQETEGVIPEGNRWDDLLDKEGLELKTFYQRLLLELGSSENERLRLIYSDASTSIAEPKNLEKIIKSIDALDWYNAKEEGLGNLYEGLLEKNASEKKSGAGQYFTPRVLIDVMVQLIDPKIGERCADPAAGTFGFMIAADQYLKNQTDDYFDIEPQEAEFQKKEAFVGMELVKDTHRLALMNALLHNIEGRLEQGDTLSGNGKWMKNFDVILTNPPFGTKKGGERVSRDDLTFETSNKQLNFLQLIYNALKDDGNARAAVILPDNVLFESGIGSQIRRDLMNKCNLHTILRLPTGIFYAQGVKTNVLFFTRGTTDQDNTKDVWVYDLRTNMTSFGKRNQLTMAHFENFMKAYVAEDRSKIEDERWNVFTREDIAKKDDSLDIGLIADESLSSYDNLPDPIASAEEAIVKLQQAMDLLNEVVEELRAVEEDEVVKRPVLAGFLLGKQSYIREQGADLD
ncbi:N-6 DNA methylase, partial [Bacillus velezensis]|uniref:class I SAM-dependent DNA methyltransferase n=3 Tax=Bacillus velezensis TaxID=492670 RepID=UPI00384DE413